VPDWFAEDGELQPSEVWLQYISSPESLQNKIATEGTDQKSYPTATDRSRFD
jgi:hypothetical protein